MNYWLALLKRDHEYPKFVFAKGEQSFEIDIDINGCDDQEFFIEIL
jgi:hypothetical protein